MHRIGALRGASLAAAAIMLAACSSGGSTSPTATPAGGGGTGTSGPGATSQSGGGGGLSGLKACSLLTPAEIQAAIGVAVNDGLEQDTDGQVECNWDPTDANADGSVSVSVATFDSTLWNTLSSAQNAKPVSGVGEAAFSGVPHSGDLSIKQSGYMIEIGIVSFTLDQSKISAADTTFANLVLGRI